ncbi:hypothetical protein SAMN03159355_00043 [Pseudomonas sp. NFPP10]|nr:MULTISPECIES: hypothetical protein [Pseudomonas]BCQ61786.1 hypothetical protein PBOI14_35360 [Pseudomonas sp. Boi14]MBP5098833.1 hypothetical protein [Pseudomonas protegens]MBP5119707.1 hypothetical protein [Pseudomonas protegens]MBP5122880.1 hypothetical protein [Pseudomonas protegens]POA85884.1 hypothetical protein C1883_21425 [Pseudomonas protegens]
MNSLVNAYKALEVLTQDEFNRRFPQKHTLGEVVLGMGELVEVLKKDNGLSLRKIAEIADVSVAGLDRWRNNGYGSKKHCEKLIAYCQQLLGETLLPHPVATAPAASVAQSLRACSPAQLEAAIERALQAQLGFPDSLECTLVRMEAGADGHRLEILLR